MEKQHQANLHEFAWIINKTGWPLQVTITKTTPLWQKDAAEIQREKRSRQPDRGAQLVAQEEISNNATWHFKRLEYFYVRALQTWGQSHDGKTKYFAPGVSAAPIVDYVELFNVKTAPGRVVVFFQATDRVSVVGKSYSWNQCKAVDDDLAITDLRVT